MNVAKLRLFRVASGFVLVIAAVAAIGAPQKWT
jgi:hypothetical protein